MARNFTITTPAETVLVGPDGRGEMLFTVTNVSGTPNRGLAKVAPLGNTNAEWLTLMDVEREFPVGGVQQYRVAANIPPGTPAGRYTWRFDVVSALKGGESSDVGPTVAFEVPATGSEKKGIPWWVWLAIAIGAIVLAVVLYLVFRKKDPPPPPPPPPVEEKVEVPNLIGRDVVKALLQLEQLGLDHNVDAVFVKDVNRVNKVEKQDPPPGTKVDKGTVVTIGVGQRRGKFVPGFKGETKVSPQTKRALDKLRRQVEKSP